MEVGFLKATTGDVVGEDASLFQAEVVTREQGNDDETLHRHGEVRAHHLAELVRFALEAQAGAFDLLVVLELSLEEANHLDGGPGGPGDGDS